MLNPNVTLEPFQKEGVKIICDHFKNNDHFILADETGLGKGVQALAVAEKYKNLKVAIVSRAMIKPKWILEIRNKVKDSKNKYYVFTYSGLRDKNALAIAKRLKYDLIVFDEFHHAKDMTTQQTQALFGVHGLIHNTKKSIAVSATPCKNRVGELYPYLQAIAHPLAYGGEEAFIRRWAKSVRPIRVSAHKTILTHTGTNDNIFILRDGLKDMFLRRYKRVVRPHIKPAKRHTINIELDSDFLAKQKELFEASNFTASDIMFLTDPEYLDAHLDMVPELEKFAQFKHALGHYKIPFVLKWVEKWLLPKIKNNENIKFILYAQHKKVLKTYQTEIQKFLKAALKKHSYKKEFPLITHITGEIPHDDRFDLSQVADATENSILFATMDSLTEGIDLTNFSSSLFTETAYTPGTYEQLEGRTDRLYSKEQSNYFYFIADTALEKHIVKLLTEKSETQDKLYGRTKQAK